MNANPASARDIIAGVLTIPVEVDGRLVMGHVKLLGTYCRVCTGLNGETECKYLDIPFVAEKIQKNEALYW